MSSDKPNTSNRYILIFISMVCLICALILSIFAIMLRPLQEREETIYQSKQLLIASKILNHQGYFLLQNQHGEFVPAIYNTKKQMLTTAPDHEKQKASSLDILAIQHGRVVPMLTDADGNLMTFKENNIDYETYLQDNKKYGYAYLPLKLVYVIYPNLPLNTLKASSPFPIGYVIPINGYGLWDAIYGFLAIQADAKTIIGTTWYDQKETPGLGANIASPEWQKQFHDKIIFRPSSDGAIHFDQSRLGITVVKTTVKEEIASVPLQKNAVDGIAGATVTRNGVQEAYHQSLLPYRAFFIQAHERYLNHQGKQ